MKLGLLARYFKSIKRPHYVNFNLGYLFFMFIAQRIFKINSDVPFLVHFTNKISGMKNIKLEDDTLQVNFLSSGGCYFAAFDGTTIEIGKGTIWAYNVCVQTANHVPGNLNEYNKKSVKIGRNCWLGNGVVITAGVEIGDNVVVGANSVVTKSFPANKVIGGVPAKIIRDI
jgi:acetyltransferase-like isoleucine patch superfamily enzyme